MMTSRAQVLMRKQKANTLVTAALSTSTQTGTQSSAQSTECCMANSQYGMRRKTSRVEASVEISNTATLHCRGSRTQPGVRVQDDAAACPSNIEVAAMQNSEHIIIDLGRQLLGTREETAKTSWKDCRHPLSSLNQDEVVALQRSIHLKWIDNTNVDSPDRSHPKSRSSSTEFRKSQPLFSSTETMDVDSRHRYDVDCLSPLQLWMYQNSKDNMTFAERLEKSKWEDPRLEKL